MACIQFACIGFVFSALSYSKCSHSVRKQRSEELGPANSSLSAVWQRSQIGCEMAELGRQTSAPDCLSELKCSAATMNSTTATNVGSRRSKGHSQICILDEHSNSLKPSQGSVAVSTDSSSQVYVFAYVIWGSLIWCSCSCCLILCAIVC